MRTFLRGRHVDPALTGTLAVLRLLPTVSRRKTLLLAVAVLLATALPLAFTIITGVLIGAIPAAVRAGLNAPAGHHVLLILLLAALVTVAQRVLGPLNIALGTVFGREVDRQLRERVMAAVGRPWGIAHLEDSAVLDLMGSAQGVGTQGNRPGDAVVSLVSLVPDWLFALGSAAILMRFHWWLGLIWIIIWPIILYYLQREYIRVGQTASGEAGGVRRADYYRSLALTPGAAKELRVWGLTGWLADRFETSWLGAMAPVWRSRHAGRSVLWSTTAVVAGFSLVTYGLLAWSAVHGEVTLAALTVYIYATINATGFRAFDDANMTLAYAAVSVPSLLILEARLQGEEDHGRLDLPAESPQESIRFENVRFRYPGADEDTLAGLDLELPAGRSLAIVGANGAGKTTLVKLLCRLYEPASGRISVDGIDLTDVDPEVWRSRLAAIFQDFTHYALSARDNVVLGSSNEAHRLHEAAERAGARGLVEALPGGWDTVLSRQFAEGTELSGGQWQRLALARALFAVERGARVLILDEPTANLDVRAEAEIYDRFLDLTTGLTTVLISHRFSTVRRAQRIVVLADGRIAEAGTHDELVVRGGTYAEMFRLQAERFALEEIDA